MTGQWQPGDMPGVRSVAPALSGGATRDHGRDMGKINSIKIKR